MVDAMEKDVYESTKGGVPAKKQNWPGGENHMPLTADHGEESYHGSEKLLGKKALITGGDSGIGRAVAIAFAREGADVAIIYLNEHDDAKETAKFIEQEGRKAILLPIDLTTRQSCLDAVENSVSELGGLNILVNNAAYQKEVSGIEELTESQVEQTFKTNIFAYIWMAQAALKHLHDGDAIINTGSVTGLEGSPSLLDYSATKGAIHTFTKALAGSIASRGIRVNCVAPGPVWTPLIPSTLSKEHIERFGSDTYWQRPAQPAEIAPSYVFLASHDSIYYTGEIMAPTGKSTTR